MTYRLQNFLAGFAALIMAALFALAPAGANPTSGGYQLFEQAAPEHQHAIQLASLGNFAPSLETASECCNATNTGLGRSQVDEIVGTPKGQRPDPSTYMSQAEIDAHLAQFDDGAVRFFTPHPSGSIGPRDTFVFPKSAIDDLYTRTGGDIRAVERELGLPSGYFDNAQVAIIDNPKVRMPSGNEAGANDFWVPGGHTSGGIPEATLPGTTNISDVTVVSPQELFQ